MKGRELFQVRRKYNATRYNLFSPEHGVLLRLFFGLDYAKIRK